MSFVIIGEAATKVMDGYSDFADAHPEVPWRSMRGMRNRIAHGYFDINLDVVWDTVQTALPELLRHLHALQGGAGSGPSNGWSSAHLFPRMPTPRQRVQEGARNRRVAVMHDVLVDECPH